MHHPLSSKTQAAPRSLFFSLIGKQFTPPLAWISIAALGLSCSTPSFDQNATPESPRADASHVETLAVFATNDIHGALLPLRLKTKESDPTQVVEYEAGGLAYLASYLEYFREEFGNSFLWLDAGDEFQGSIESNIEQGAPMVSFFNFARLQAAAIGNHEFDYGPSLRAQPLKNGMGEDRLGALKDRMAQAQYPYLSANTYLRGTETLATSLLPHLRPSALIPVNGIQVGIVGLSTEDTPITTSSLNVQDLSFHKSAQAALRESKKLREQGAEIVLLVAHVGLWCESGRMTSESRMRKPSDPQGLCDPQGELVRLLQSLPTGTFDAVVSGHSHQVVHHWVAGVPVVQGGAFGKFFNVIYLNFDKKSRKIIPELSRIEGPIPVCPKVFENQNDCNGDRPAPEKGRGRLVTPRFHGEKIEIHSETADFLKELLKKSEAIKSEWIADLSFPLEHDRKREAPLGNLVADAIRKSAQSDVAMMNAGGIRSSWEQGRFTFGDLYRSLPFDNAIVKLQVTGAQLKKILRVGENGQRGVFPVSGVELTLLPPEQESKTDDLNQNGKVEPWEANRLVDVRLIQETAQGVRKVAIEDQKTYTLATLDFLVTGGDDMEWAMSQIPPSQRSAPIELLRDAVLRHVKELAKNQLLLRENAPFWNPNAARIRYASPTQPKNKRSGTKRSKRRR